MAATIANCELRLFARKVQKEDSISDSTHGTRFSGKQYVSRILGTNCAIFPTRKKIPDVLAWVNIFTKFNSFPNQENILFEKFD